MTNLHYWNQENFEGLGELALALSERPLLIHLSEYCQFREMGLRKDAFASLERFLRRSESFDVPEARSSIIDILSLHARTPGVHQFLTQPLVQRFIIPTLRSWTEHDPMAAEPLRWLGVLTRNERDVALALKLNPEDMIARRYLVNRRIREVEYATHHLSEGLFIGGLAEAKSTLSEARELIALAPKGEPFLDLAREIEYLESLLADWSRFTALPEGAFRDWCEARGRKYRWWSTVYYGEGTPDD